MSNKKVVIFGDTQLAELVHYYLAHDSPYEIAAFTVDRDFIKQPTLCGRPVVPFEDIEAVYPAADYDMGIGVGFRDWNGLRAAKYRAAKNKGYRLVSYVSSKAVTWSDLKIGENCAVFEGATIQPFVTLGNDVVVSPGAVIAHHAMIGDHCFIAASAVVLGFVRLGPYCVVGANATIRDSTTVAAESVISAGSYLANDAVEKGVYIGQPRARRGRAS